MMKPNIDDVFEYVKAGENEPGMEEMLSLHPDGPELLKQARFICRMLQRQPESKDDGEVAASMDLGIAGLRNVLAEQSPEVMHERVESRTFYQSSAPPSDDLTSFLIDDFVDDGGEVEDLGTLEFIRETARVTLSYDRSEASTQKDFQGIVIPGRGYTVSMPEVLAAGEFIAIRLNQKISNLPVKRLEIIFMPDSGPFVRVETDSQGLAELPVPDQPGTLRFNSGIPQILHIKLKK